MKTLYKEQREIKTGKKIKQISGAEAVVKSLLAEGVELIFGYPGGAIMPVYDALLSGGSKLRHVLVRHEQGAIHAAQGYARAKRGTGVCLVTSGPGATNLVTGLADAKIDSTAVVCITGQVNSALLGSDAFQETDIIGLTLPVTKWSIQVTQAAEIMPAIAKAFYIAGSGRPGPVLIDITKDAQSGMCEDAYQPCRTIKNYYPKPSVDQKQLRSAAELLSAAERPLVLAGQGVHLSGAQRELLSLAEKGNLPVASTLLGLSCFPADHALYAGFLGMHGNYAPNLMTNACDVLLAVGMRFDDRVTGELSRYAKQARIIHIDIDASEFGKNVKPEIAMHADAREALAGLAQFVKRKPRTDWLNKMKELKKTEYEAVTEKEFFPAAGPVRMAEAIRMLDQLTAGKALLLTDVGQHQMSASRYYRFTQTDSYITSGGLGTMGFALPAAVGAQLACADRPVVAVTGDGGVQMNIQELATIFQENIPVKIMILNNNYLGMVRQWQELFFEKRYSSVEMVNPDFVKLAQAYGITALAVRDRDKLRKAMHTMLESPGPFLLEVVVEKEENIFPMIPPGCSVSEVRLS
ncbi:MAG: acetolactate synthase I/II/III large subunit [Bacteroidetes bacterium]|nr:MAG: acetolactate synthase I/II/III large subunit [Bacteroidota bacterium]